MVSSHVPLMEIKPTGDPPSKNTLQTNPPISFLILGRA